MNAGADMPLRRENAKLKAHIAKLDRENTDLRTRLANASKAPRLVAKIWVHVHPHCPHPLTITVPSNATDAERNGAIQWVGQKRDFDASVVRADVVRQIQ
jgi:hypothetical protein